MKLVNMSGSTVATDVCYLRVKGRSISGDGGTTAPADTSEGRIYKVGVWRQTAGWDEMFAVLSIPVTLDVEMTRHYSSEQSTNVRSHRRWHMSIHASISPNLNALRSKHRIINALDVYRACGNSRKHHNLNKHTAPSTMTRTSKLVLCKLTMSHEQLSHKAQQAS